MKKVTKVFSVMVASVALAAMLSGCGDDKKTLCGSRHDVQTPRTPFCPADAFSMHNDNKVLPVHPSINAS